MQNGHYVMVNASTCNTDIQNRHYVLVNVSTCNTDIDTEWTLCHGKCFYL